MTEFNAGFIYGYTSALTGVLIVIALQIISAGF